MADIWYYAEGDKSAGPLSLTDLRAILPRISNAKNTLVWRDGFSSWVKAEDVPELAPYVIEPAPAITAPTSPTVVTKCLRYCFDFSGRFNRTNFWIGYGFTVLMMMPLTALYATLPDNTAAAAVLGLWIILWSVSILAVATKRLHDLDHSGLALLAFFAVLIALSFVVRQQDRQYESLILGIGIIFLGSIRGTKGTNRFGRDPNG